MTTDSPMTLFRPTGPEERRRIDANVAEAGGVEPPVFTLVTESAAPR